MRKIVAAINMTLDGYCDHTAIEPDEEIHEHYKELIESGEAILYGRITYELMQFWQSLVRQPSGEKSMDDFAVAIDNIPKIVFSNTLERTGWDSATLSTQPLAEKALALKQNSNGGKKDILVGSRSIIMQLLTLNLVDELQLCIHPVIAGKGLLLFENFTDRTLLQLTHTKTFKGGAVIHYYQLKNLQ